MARTFYFDEFAFTHHSDLVNPNLYDFTAKSDVYAATDAAVTNYNIDPNVDKELILDNTVLTKNQAYSFSSIDFTGYRAEELFIISLIQASNEGRKERKGGISIINTKYPPPNSPKGFLNYTKGPIPFGQFKLTNITGKKTLDECYDLTLVVTDTVMPPKFIVADCRTLYDDVNHMPVIVLFVEKPVAGPATSTLEFNPTTVPGLKDFSLKGVHPILVIEKTGIDYLNINWKTDVKFKIASIKIGE